MIMMPLVSSATFDPQSDYTYSVLNEASSNRSPIGPTTCSRACLFDSSPTSSRAYGISSESPYPRFSGPANVALPANVFPSPTNVQHHLSNYISEALLSSTDFTVWDRPWAPNEDVRAGCCNDSINRQELGRLRYSGEPLVDRTRKNPLKRIEEQGGGLFELDWRERACLLRQLVDWQRELSGGCNADGSDAFRSYSINHQPRKQGHGAKG